MGDLTGQRIDLTYDGLIKTNDEQPIDGTLKALQDGVGNNLPVEVSTSSVNFTGTVTGDNNTTYTLDAINDGNNVIFEFVGSDATQQDVTLIPGTNVTFDLLNNEITINAAGGGAGTSGTSGTNGLDGTSGTSGVNGLDGTSGTSGINGLDGTSGTSGTSGVDGTFFGSSGTSGTSGINGLDGTSGTSGVNGLDGTSGTSGVNGIDGTSGTSGADGPTGPAGTSGTSGSSGTSGGGGLTGARYLYVAGTGPDPVSRGIELKNVYFQAKTLIPTATSPITILVGPGTYSMNFSPLDLDTSYIDIKSVSGETDVIITDPIEFVDFVNTSRSFTLSTDNIKLENLYFKADVTTANSGGVIITTNTNSGIVIKNCNFEANQCFAGEIFIMSTSINIDIAATFENVWIGPEAYILEQQKIYDVTDQTTIPKYGYNFDTEAYLSFTGTQSGNYINVNAFGRNIAALGGTASGYFENCSATGNFSFSGLGTASGTFIRCVGPGGFTFGGDGGTITGLIEDCVLGQGAGTIDSPGFVNRSRLVFNAFADQFVSRDFNIGTGRVQYSQNANFIQMIDYAAINFADDAAAAAAGIPLGGMYHTAGTLKVRIV